MPKVFRLYGPNTSSGLFDYFTGEPIGEQPPSVPAAGNTRPWGGGYNPGGTNPDPTPPPTPPVTNKFVLLVSDNWEGYGALEITAYSTRLTEYFKMLNWYSNNLTDRGALNPNIVGELESLKTTVFPTVLEVNGYAIAQDTVTTRAYEAKY